MAGSFLKSLKENLVAIGRHWLWIIFGFLLPAARAGETFLGLQVSVIPYWVDGLVILICVIVAQFLAFHDIRKQRDELQVKRHKQELLDQISELRDELGTMRINMEIRHHARQFTDAEWQPQFDALQEKIGKTIREFSSKAEENLYRRRGNINRAANTMVGGYVWPVLIDTAAHDLEHLKKFVQDYSRGNA